MKKPKNHKDPKTIKLKKLGGSRVILLHRETLIDNGINPDDENVFFNLTNLGKGKILLEVDENPIQEFANFFARNPDFVADENLLGDNLDDTSNEEWKWTHKK